MAISVLWTGFRNVWCQGPFNRMYFNVGAIAKRQGIHKYEDICVGHVLLKYVGASFFSTQYLCKLKWTSLMKINMCMLFYFFSFHINTQGVNMPKKLWLLVYSHVCFKAMDEAEILTSKFSVIFTCLVLEYKWEPDM